MNDTLSHPVAVPRAVIWDVDGTLVDSGPLHFESWRATLLNEQYALTEQAFQSTFGQRNDAVLQAWLGPSQTADAIVRIGDAKEEFYRELVRSRGLEPLPGVRRWLAALQAAGWRQAIASSAPMANLDLLIDVLGFAPYFDAVVSGDEVERGKPDPAIFRLAAQRLGVAPRRCVVVEDAPVGVEGARRAGMRTVGVLFGHDKLDADLVTASLDDLAPDAFERLVSASP
jgi:HAD superfamily hydrolase (TIGR01509 family)